MEKNLQSLLWRGKGRQLWRSVSVWSSSAIIIIQFLKGKAQGTGFSGELDNWIIRYSFEKHDDKDMRAEWAGERQRKIFSMLWILRKSNPVQNATFSALDEILTLPDYMGSLLQAIGDILKMKDESMHILLTGQTLPDSPRKYADSITTLTTGDCIRCIKQCIVYEWTVSMEITEKNKGGKPAIFKVQVLQS